MSEIYEELLSSSPYAIIQLYELHLYQNLHGSSEAVRFHAGVNGKMPAGAIIWNGNEYQPLPIETEGFDYSGTGQLPRPKVRVSNLFGGISALLLGVNEFTPGNDLTGARLVRIRTLSRFLDPANFPNNVNPYGTPDPTAEMPQEIYYVDRKSAENRDIVEFELAAVFDLAGVRAPKRQAIANICQWKYRSAECGYTGSNFFDENDNSLATEPAPNIAAGTSSISMGQNVDSPGQLVSANGWFRTQMQADGNLVTYNKAGTAVWASNTPDKPEGGGSYRLRAGVQGNLFIQNLSNNQVIWQTYTGNIAGVTSIAFIPDANGGPISWVPTDRTQGRSGSFGWELFGAAPSSGNTTARRTFYSPTSISPGRFIEIEFSATALSLPAGHYSGLTHTWGLTGMTIISSGGFWNLNETFNATISIGSGNPFRNSPEGALSVAGPQVQITGTTGFASNTLVMQNDGNLVLYSSSNTALWSSGYVNNTEPRIAVSGGDPAKDVCGKRLSSCKLRFGENAELPFGSFPSVGGFFG
jgi:lambda family phage minor tail protein L